MTGSKFTITKKALGEKEKIAHHLLEAQGIDADMWLSQKYDEVINDHSAQVIKGLKLLDEKNKKGGGQYAGNH